MRLTLSLLLLASAPEAATPPPPTQEVIALIWGEGRMSPRRRSLRAGGRSRRSIQVKR
jgi:hypothetical protein